MGAAPVLLGGDAGAFHRLIRLLVVAFDVRAPWLGLHGARRLPHHIELAIGLDLADEHRLVQVMIFSHPSSRRCRTVP